MSKSDGFIDQLYKIIEIEGLDRLSGLSARKQALSNWIKEWIVEVSVEQSMIKTNLSIEEEDYLKYYCSKVIGEALMDDCIQVEVGSNKLKLNISAIKRRR